ncbi:hypothetical protein GCM10027073_27260 [Streptomyces chlorus]
MRELLDGTNIDTYGTSSDTRLLTGSGVASNNGTKATPVLSGDILGDWPRGGRPAPQRQHRAAHLFHPARHQHQDHDAAPRPLCRTSPAWQNTAYNQPPHAGFFLGDGMSTPPRHHKPALTHTHQNTLGLSQTSAVAAP